MNFYNFSNLQSILFCISCSHSNSPGSVTGNAFFMENGIETGNVMRYNLGIFVKPSSSTLNVDITPGIYWITNANNTVSHNAAAGGTHFGYWYQMFDHPDGPSFTTSICPR